MKFIRFDDKEGYTRIINVRYIVQIQETTNSTKVTVDLQDPFNGSTATVIQTSETIGDFMRKFEDAVINV
jgi:hypothetical protein